MSRPKRSKKPTTYFGYRGSDEDDDFATSPPKKTKPMSDSDENGIKCLTEPSEATVNSRNTKTSRPSRDERLFQKDIDVAIQKSAGPPCIENHVTSDSKCSDDNDASHLSDKENVQAVSREAGDLSDKVDSGKQRELTVERDCEKRDKRKTKSRRLESESNGDESDCHTDENNDAEYQASLSSEPDVEDDDDDDIFSSDSDNSFNTGSKRKKETKSNATKVKKDNKKSTGRGQGKGKPTHGKASKPAHAPSETVRPQSRVKNEVGKPSSKQKGASITRPSGKSKSESQRSVSNSSTLSMTLSTVRRPACVPPTKNGQNNLGGVKITSPCSSIRLGLSRNIRVGQPLHPTARRPP